MKISKFLLSFFITLVVLPIAAQAQISSGGAFSIEKSAVAGGGGKSSNGEFSVTGTIGQDAAGKTQTNGAFLHQSGFWVKDEFVPTAATATISGSVKTANGSGIRNANVILTAQDGTTRTVTTGSFGSFRFNDVEVGQTYILSIASKKFVFPNSARVISVTEDIAAIEFTAQD